MQEGPLTGSPCRDIRVCVYDGKMHPVDSNDMAFQIAGAMVFKNAFQQAAPQLMEPIYDVEILCEDDVMGDIMGDLQTRRAMIMGMEAEGHYQKIKARIPLQRCTNTALHSGHCRKVRPSSPGSLQSMHRCRPMFKTGLFLHTRKNWKKSSN